MSALLWGITWPSGKLRVYVDSFKAFVHQALRRANIIIVFDRYNSIETFTRTQRSGSSRVYKLPPDMQALANQVVLTNTKNKIQLNAMPTESIFNPGYFTESTQTHTPTNAGVSDVPVEITGGLRIDRHDLRSTHEEADILIAQHASSSLSLSGKSVRVVCDDTYVFVPLVHYHNSRRKGSNSAQMIMSSPVKE